jgi:hypothetical protein
MIALATFLGLVLNLIGTVIVGLSATRVLTSIHAALMMHQTTIEAWLGGSKDVPIFTGVDESRERELKKSARLVAIGLWFIIAGFLLQVASAFPKVLRLLRG